MWRGWFSNEDTPRHLRHGRLGEVAARRHLETLGLRYLTANWRSLRGELDLVFQDGSCLVFVEVKTRSSEQWTRPAAAVNRTKRRHLTRAALDYLRTIGKPRIPFRFDIVEVLLQDDGSVREIRHIPNAFPLSDPYRYG